ncbi:hypothetical protein lerEdw1_020964 [Lerista edwardsae]|nr:hypothetical protein lerEdw1_020964 [Lerista edwardsae]
MALRAPGALPAAPLPPQPAPEAVAARLRAVAGFLRRVLPLCSAHTVEFFTRGLWEELVALPPETVLEALSGEALRQLLEETTPPRPLEEAADSCEVSKIFCEKSQRLVNVRAFALAAKRYSLPNLGVCVPLEQMLEALNRKQQPTSGMKTDDFMNNKKSHEVQLMSELVDGIANYCGLKQVIDLGSGKGYLSSFLSMQYNLKVYGIDSSNTNTHGANERNRKLKKHWRAYQSRARANVRGQVLEEAKERAERDKEKCKANISEKLLSTHNSLQRQTQVALPDSILFETADVFIDSDLSITNKQCELHSGAQLQPDEHNVLENVFLNVLPADAVEMDCLPKSNWKELCEEERERRKMASLKAKESRSKETNLYSPLTSYITAETELRDIVADLEDCVMVGLHTCGDLASSTLRLFTAKPEIKAVCSVGCCYHLLSEECESQKDGTQGTWGFPMCRYLKEEGWFCGRNARMAACLALERVAVGQVLPTESLFYRAVLQVIVEEFYGVNRSDRNIGKVFSKSSSFLDYVRKSLRKLELDESKISDGLILQYLEKYKHRMNELEAFNMVTSQYLRDCFVLKSCAGTLYRSADASGSPLLPQRAANANALSSRTPFGCCPDQIFFLQDNIAWSGLVKLFDPIKSPRCYAIVAVKEQAPPKPAHC